MSDRGYGNHVYIVYMCDVKGPHLLGPESGMEEWRNEATLRGTGVEAPSLEKRTDAQGARPLSSN